MWLEALKAFAALGAIATLITVLYRTYWSPAAKAKRQAAKDGIKANAEQNISGVTSAFDQLNRKIMPIIIITLLLFAGGCGWFNPPVELHPITGLDIIPLVQGEQIIWVEIKTGEKHTGAPVDGYFFSKEYVDTVIKAKVK